MNCLNVSMFHFADEIAFIGKSEEDLEQLIKTMNKTLIRELSMKINVQKHKSFCWWKEK